MHRSHIEAKNQKQQIQKMDEINCALSLLPRCSACSHRDLVKSKTLGKLTVKCAECSHLKKWPWVKMVKCSQCKRVWHQRCISLRSRPPNPSVVDRPESSDGNICGPSVGSASQEMAGHFNSEHRSARALTTVSAEVLLQSAMKAHRFSNARDLARISRAFLKTFIMSCARPLAELSCQPLDRFRAIVSPPLRVAEGPCNHETVAVSRVGVRLEETEVEPPVVVRSPSWDMPKEIVCPLKAQLEKSNSTCVYVTQKFIKVRESHPKMYSLLELFINIEDCQILICVNDKETANKVAALLSLSYYSASSIHFREESQRYKILNNFKNNDEKILVVTDDYVERVLADCVDILVVNYDLPKTIEVFIWRMKCISESNVDSKIKVISLYMSTTDRNLVPALVDYLKLTDQQIPHFILEQQ